MLGMILHAVRTVAGRFVAASASIKLSLPGSRVGLESCATPPLPFASSGPGRDEILRAKCWCGYIRCGDPLFMARPAYLVV